jgi:argininosuccinate synthase
MSDKINRIVLAFSGGLDTSVILKWLQQTYQCEVVTFTADLGQGEELEPARAKARQGRAYLHRRPARRICGGLCLPDDALQRAL